MAAVIADSVIVYDQMRAILNVVGPDLEFVRDVTLAHIGQFNALEAVRWPLVLVEKKRRSPPDGSQLVLQTVDMRGRAAIPTDSFVIERRLGPSALRSALPLGFAIGPANTVWTWEPTEYRLDAWSLDGQAQDQVRREASWFPALLEDRAGNSGSPDRPPDPYLAALRVDARSEFWAFSGVPAPGWREAWTPEMREALTSNPGGQRIRGARSTSRPEKFQLYQTLLEIIDVRAGKVMTRQRLPGYVVDAFPDGRVALYHEDEGGVPYIDVVSLKVVAQ